MCDNCKLPVTWTWCQGIDISTCSCTACSLLQPGPVCLPSWAPPGREGRAGCVFVLNLYTTLMAFWGRKPHPKPSLQPPFVVRKPLGGSAVCARVFLCAHIMGGPSFWGVSWTRVCFAHSVKLLWCPGQKAGEEKCSSSGERGQLLHLHGCAAKEVSVPKCHSQRCHSTLSNLSQPFLQTCTHSVCLARSPEEQRSLLLIVIEQKWHKTPPCSPLLP